MRSTSPVLTRPPGLYLGVPPRAAVLTKNPEVILMRWAGTGKHWAGKGCGNVAGQSAGRSGASFLSLVRLQGDSQNGPREQKGVPQGRK